jgi:hypothetical protein
MSFGKGSEFWEELGILESKTGAYGQVQLH